MITRKTLPYKVSELAGHTLMSDLHIGSAHTDHDSIIKDLKIAEEANDRININGDIFDCILPKDHKRYRPDALHPDLQGRSDVANASLAMGVEILGPFAKRIDMIGLGNHEAALEKYHGLDLVQLLVHELNTHHGGDITYGGYTGFIDYRYQKALPSRGKKHTRTNRFIIYYHHGSGGIAPVTKGMIGFHRKATFIDSNVVWESHKHNKIVDATPLRMRCPREGTQPVLDQQVFVMTGGYLDTYRFQTHKEAMSGRAMSYASDWGLPPQAKGGVRLLVKFDRSSGIERIQVVS